jgi:hypothetical protein
VSALLALALAAAPGCPGALAEAAALAGEPPALAHPARALVDRLEAVGAGGPVDAVRRAAEALGDPAAPRGAAPGEPLARFRRVLERHCALAGAPAGPGASAADRAALAAILARPEYARGAADPEAIRRRILQRWADLLELLGTSEAERYASTGRAIFLGAVLAALAAIYVAARRRRGAAGARRAGEIEAAGAPRAAEATAEDAAEALARGDAREAVRRAFLAALAALERAGVVQGGRTLTNGEIVAAVGGGPTPIATDVAALARLFDRAVYGRLPVSPEDARAAVARARAIAALAAARR